MISDPMASRFCLMDDDRRSATRSTDPLSVDQAFYSDSEWQSELGRFANRGIQHRTHKGPDFGVVAETGTRA